ncbi:hypothetical protein B4U80_09560, partial [Leptotrombidium deliense]
MSAANYNEVSASQLMFNNWREITLDIGASQSTLQDFKLTESSGFFSYNDSNSWLSPTSNRFIYWRIHNDIVELCELSLDVNLIGNQLRLRFQNTHVLDGVSIHETGDQVFILIATVASVHRLILPHPRKLANDFEDRSVMPDFKQFIDSSGTVLRTSIFFNVTTEKLRESNSYRVLNDLYNVGSSSFTSSAVPFPVTCCSWLTNRKEAVFVLGNSVGTLLVVQMSSEAGKVISWELKQTKFMERLWKGLIPSIMRGNQEGTDVAVSIVSHASYAGDDYFVFALCRDLRIRMWSYLRQELLIVHNVLNSSHCNLSQHYTTNGNNAVGKGQHSFNVRRPVLRKVIPINDSNNLYLAAFIAIADQKQFIIMKLVFEEATWKLKTSAVLAAPEEDIRDFIVTNDRIWSLSISSENEIRSQIGSNELTADEYTSLEHTSWEKFYSYCTQYHSVANKPLGLFLDPNTGLIGFIKKNTLSFLKPAQVYDDVIMFNKTFDNSRLKRAELEVTLETNVISFLNALKTFSDNLTEEMLLNFELGMETGEVVETIAQEIVDNFLIVATDVTTLNADPLKNTFDNLFIKTPLLIEAIEAILKSLDFEETVDTEFSTTNTIMPILSQFLSSNVGICLLSESIRQVSRMRYNFCRELLLFETFLLQLRDKKGFTAPKIEKMHTSIVPTTAIYLQACYFMCWVCETPMRCDGNVVGLEEVISQLSVLDMNEYINMNRGKQESPKTNDFVPKTILSRFIHHNRCSLGRRLLSAKFAAVDGASTAETYTTALPLMVHSILQLLWPMSNMFYLPEFLLGYGQYQLILQYTQLLDSWCQYNVYSRQFLKGFVYLVLGETNKTIELFQESSFGIGKEHLFRRLINAPVNEHETENEELLNPVYLFNYYNKLIQLAKIHSQPETVIQLASQGILMLDSATDTNYDEHYSSLLITLFISHLEMDNISDAYQTMILNPNESQRKNCLRQFILTLCERKKYEELISFSFNDLDEDFVNILESRARACDLLSTAKDRVTHYEILHAYFVSNNNFRKAAAIAYEYARRLSHEVPGFESLAKQVKFYAIALNCLKLVKDKYAWVIKPTLKVIPSIALSTSEKNTSINKRTYEGTDILIDAEDDTSLNSAVKKSIEVLDVNDLQREYQLANVRLKLLQKDP